MRIYKNFDLELFSYDSAGGQEQFSVRVKASPAGPQGISDADKVAVAPGLRARVAALEARELDRREVIALGSELAALLLPQGARELLYRSRDMLGRSDRLRIRMMPETYRLADLPWEYVYLSDPDAPNTGTLGFLSLDRTISITRWESLNVPYRIQSYLPPDSRLRMIVLLSNPGGGGYGSLDVEAEEQIIRRALKGITNINVEVYRAGRLRDLDRALDEDAHIFHFAGHGEFAADMGELVGTVDGKGYLVLTEGQLGSTRYPVDSLAKQLRDRGVRVALLSACESAKTDGKNPWTGIAPALVKRGIPGVVGMQYTVSDENALRFAENFYRALAAEKPIDEAVSEGRIAADGASAGADRDWGVPVLYLGTDESLSFPVRAGIRLWANGLLTIALTAAVVFTAHQHFYGVLQALLRWPALIVFPVVVGLWGLLRNAKVLNPVPFRTWVRKTLGKTMVTRILVGGLVLVAAGFFSMVSIYIEYPDTSDAKAEYQFSIAQGTQVLIPNLSVGPARTISGRVFPFRWNRDSFEVRLLDPPGPEPRHEPVRFGSAHLKVVPSTWYRDVFLVKLVPQGRLYRELPLPDADARLIRNFSIQLTMLDIELTKDSLRLGTLVLGTNPEFAKRLVESEDPELFERCLRDYLLGFPEAVIAEHLQAARNWIYWGTPEFGEADSLVIRIATEEEVILESSFRITMSSCGNVVFLEAP